MCFTFRGNISNWLHPTHSSWIFVQSTSNLCHFQPLNWGWASRGEVRWYSILFQDGHWFKQWRIEFLALQELIEEQGLHIVSFDRAGYGQSDHNPKRSIESDVDDVEDLADGLSLGPKFYVITTSIGGYTGWGLLKYKPERLAGIALSAPVVNWWWPSLPASEVKLAWEKQMIGDQMSLRVAHYFPALTYWYMTQKWFPTSSVSPQSGIKAFCLEDQEILKKSGAVLARTTPEVCVFVCVCILP